MTQIRHKIFIITSAILLLSASMLASALDVGSESTADKADHFDFEAFHKEKGITLWESKENKVVDPASTAKSTTTSTTTKPASVAPVDKTTVNSDAPEKSVAEQNLSAKNVYEKGTVLKVRAAYKLGNDPMQRDVQSLYEAMEDLHKQLNHYCPNGWIKGDEWHKPEADHFYIYYQAVCM